MLRIFFIVYFFSSSSFAQTFTIKNINVKPHMVHQNYEHFKRLVLDSPDSEAEYIKGFDFEWGYAYKLKVKETKIGPLSDGTNFEYSLVKIVKKEKVSDTINFLLVIDPLVRYTKLDEDEIENFSLKKTDTYEYLYMDEVYIEVPENLNQKFLDLVEKEMSFLAKFNYISSKKIRLISFKRYR
tara:strand:+ start:52 stop:600 length:549 start_codon:yes stop_codon:yes gene_type:complete